MLHALIPNPFRVSAVNLNTIKYLFSDRLEQRALLRNRMTPWDIYSHNIEDTCSFIHSALGRLLFCSLSYIYIYTAFTDIQRYYITKHVVCTYTHIYINTKGEKGINRFGFMYWRVIERAIHEFQFLFTMNSKC